MATIPTSVASTTTSFQPAYQRVQQQGDFDCAFACIAMITGKTLDEIRQLAIDKFDHPAHGPYWITEHLITALLAHHRWVATVYKEATSTADLPDLAIAMVDYDPDTEIGRHTLFHRAKASHDPKIVIEYMVDPAGWIEQSMHIRTDFDACHPSWFIGVHPMSKPAKDGK
ncbi:hypothetical protein P3W85_23600 [Cupriavidus basilensis]|uniref:Peptidase C39 domain-containing protein n=1 Tax=Cupriavidus basilensis TaxID=68895 RepID=A0ABT6ATF3_9BURK|nr:hypothetical protein [Cupriavidus basilensis]MDF3835911.1 hypothetical protein [Cupriavidus basilensis]